MKLARKARCPIHGRRDCCGRSEFHRYAQVKKQGHGIWQPVRSGLWRAADGRERCSKAELRRRKDCLLRQGVKCAACGEGFSDYRDVELAHRISKGAGGGNHNDAMPNLTLLHVGANRAQGSLPLDLYLREYWKPSDCKS